MSTVDDRKRREQEYHDRVYATGEYDQRRAAKFHTVASAAFSSYDEEILRDVEGRDVLEYGCGQRSMVALLASRGARVTGIDISPVAIEQALAQASENGLDEGTDFRVMDAEALVFSASSFDLICGRGILHHLDLDRSFTEVSRVLRPSGRAVFLEPLGHNALINAYRGRTPDLRTPDEHPLLEEDLSRADDFFGRVDVRYFHLLTLAAVPLRRTRAFDTAVAALDAADRALFRLLPRLRKQAWFVILELAQPRKRA